MSVDCLRQRKHAINLRCKLSCHTGMETMAVARISNMIGGLTTFVSSDNTLCRSDFTLSSSLEYSNELTAHRLPNGAGYQLGLTLLKPCMLDSVETSLTALSLPGWSRTMLTCQIDVPQW